MLLGTIIVQCVFVCNNCVDSYTIIIDDFACDVIPIWKFNALVCRGGRYWYNCTCIEGWALLVQYTYV